MKFIFILSLLWFHAFGWDTKTNAVDTFKVFGDEINKCLSEPIGEDTKSFCTFGIGTDKQYAHYHAQVNMRAMFAGINADKKYQITTSGMVIELPTVVDIDRHGWVGLLPNPECIKKDGNYLCLYKAKITKF